MQLVSSLLLVFISFSFSCSAMVTTSQPNLVQSKEDKEEFPEFHLLMANHKKLNSPAKARELEVTFKKIDSAKLGEKDIKAIIAFIKKRFKKENFNINAEDSLEKDQGTTILSYAVLMQPIDFIGFLLLLEADVNQALKKNGNTPLMLAALTGDPKKVDLLLNAGASRKAMNYKKEMAYQFAGDSQIRKKLALV